MCLCGEQGQRNADRVVFITGKYDRNSPLRDYILAHAHIHLRTSFYHVGLHVLYLNALKPSFGSLK